MVGLNKNKSVLLKKLMPRIRKTVGMAGASPPTVPEVGVEVEIGSICTFDPISEPGPSRPRRKASTLHPGLGRFYALIYFVLDIFIDTHGLVTLLI